MTITDNKEHAYPSEFISDADFHDKNLKWHLQFPKRVPTTQFSIERGSAGKEFTELKLIDFIANANSNPYESFAARLFANGKFAALEVARSAAEHALLVSCTFNIRHMKDKNKSLDQVLLNKAKKLGLVGENDRETIKNAARHFGEAEAPGRSAAFSQC